MPQAATHLLIPAFIIALFRDFYIQKKDKRKFPLHYVLIAGIGGVLPDFDIAFYWILHFYGFTIEQVHRHFTHNLFLPLTLLLFALVFHNLRLKELGRHKLKLSLVFVMLAFGSLTHIILDWLLQGYVMPFFPLSLSSYGLNLISYLPKPLDSIFIPSLEGAILVIWVIYLEVKHKISDFI